MNIVAQHTQPTALPMSNLYVKKFVEQLEHLEARGAKDFICSIQDAKRLRNEITNLLLDLQDLREQSAADPTEVIQLEVTGGTF